MKRLILFVQTIVIVAAAMCAAAAQTEFARRDGKPDFRIPAEIEPFVETQMKASAYARGDLNGDGALDYILVLEQSLSIDTEMNNRPALIIVSCRKGRLSLAARSRLAVTCRGCSSETGDPLIGIEIKPGGFTITNRRGFREKWVGSYEFGFSPRDKNWLLARVVKTDYELGGSKPTRRATYTRPENFGEIKFADFDPDDFEGKGARNSRPKVSAAQRIMKRLDGRERHGNGEGLYAIDCDEKWGKE